MKKDTILNLSFIISILVVIVGSIFKIEHFPGAHLLLIIGVISMLVFWIIAISEIRASTKISGSEKFMWILGLIFLGGIAGLVYILSARKRIA